MARIIIAGDYCSNSRMNIISDRKFSPIGQDVIDILKDTDYSLVNLESPIAEKERDTKKIPKQGPSLIGDIRNLDYIKAAGFKGVTLANNHILDYGVKALSKTIVGLRNRDLDYVGAGMNKEEASQILYKDIKGVKVAIINCCEHEFSVATKERGGANPINIIEQYYQIQEAKCNSDFVIVIIHGGVEHFQYPTIKMVKEYRFLVDVGADAIINHHQHCPCGYEVYKGKPIYYGLGNFCFDWDGKRNSIWNIGYIVCLELNDGNEVESEIIPYSQCNDTPTVNLLEEEDSCSFKQMIKGLCESIKDENLLETKLALFNEKNDYLYRKMLEPYSGKIANGLYRRGVLPSTIKKDRVLSLVDFLICESHYERVKELLNRLYKQYFNE